ncbi:uncharacterized protein ABID56_001506 [Alkalibacillus flavidus]|uniref:DUF418 domain-containing protein n=1 Tax=Alkalibacillus flavidus TaxID=546021 RepID=A0ABV2KXY0_9BACI
MEGTRERNQAVDAIRGFALFGILVVNVLSFHSPHFMYGGSDAFYDGAGSGWLMAMIDMFFQASFYPLFAMLFGLGLALMARRLQEREPEDMKRVLRRRMLALGLFGLLHGLLIWYGDILLTYSIVGLLTIPLIHKSIRTLVTWAVSMLGSVTVLMTLMNYGMRDYLSSYRDTAAIQQSMNLYDGSYADILSRNVIDWQVMFNPVQILIMVLTIMPMFLLGVIVVKAGWVDEPKRHAQVMTKWLIVSAVIFFLFKIAPHFVGNPAWFDFTKQSIGGSFSSFFYFLVGMFVLPKLNVAWLAAVGKLSLTNYLTQSLIAFLFFYGVGFGFYGDLQLAQLMVYVLVVYSLQVLFSNLYVAQFRYGPFEWVYRTLTYGQKQPIRRSKSS